MFVVVAGAVVVVVVVVVVVPSMVMMNILISNISIDDKNDANLGRRRSSSRSRGCLRSSSRS